MATGKRGSAPSYQLELSPLHVQPDLFSGWQLPAHPEERCDYIHTKSSSPTKGIGYSLHRNAPTQEHPFKTAEVTVSPEFRSEKVKPKKTKRQRNCSQLKQQEKYSEKKKKEVSNYQRKNSKH